MTVLRTSVLWCAALALLASATGLLAPVARAEAPKPTLIAAIPVGFEYTHDPKDPDPKEASPTGLRVHYLTPYYVGVGVATFKSALQDKGGYADILDGDLGTHYNLLEITLNYQLGPVLLGYGYGTGKIAYSPSSMTVGGYTVKRKESDVIERFLSVGVMITPAWSVQASLHLLTAEMDQEFSFGSIPLGSNMGDLGAMVTTLGAGYTF